MGIQSVGVSMSWSSVGLCNGGGWWSYFSISVGATVVMCGRGMKRVSELNYLHVMKLTRGDSASVKVTCIVFVSISITNLMV